MVLITRYIFGYNILLVYLKIKLNDVSFKSRRALFNSFKFEAKPITLSSIFLELLRK